MAQVTTKLLILKHQQEQVNLTVQENQGQVSTLGQVHKSRAEGKGSCSEIPAHLPPNSNRLTTPHNFNALVEKLPFTTEKIFKTPIWIPMSAKSIAHIGMCSKHQLIIN